ncbi:type 1 glutamine amidotransferase domain-containing protein [Aliikangiella coralliicola]|uniref:Type 1 glutamine amidotransferase domain-containing protein n=2 Tax=Aliikangiella coralliicola TaxID=2592383 RepID=A0A545UDW8_9GAMM|nr:type 1 glutamine amidotransferase domain-containing protein [Aliikangiella coralliicola]
MLFIILISTAGHANVDAKILIVLTSHSDLGNTGKKTGFWLPELTHPYYEFKDAGYSVDVASIEGGMAPLDAKAFQEADEYHQKFLNDAELMAKVIRSIPLSQVNPEDYKVILFAGGSGPMWDFPKNKDISRISSAIYERNGIVSAVCHGNAALIDIKLSDGKYLIADKRVSAFTNEEEQSLGTTEIVPFLLQDKLVERGAIHVYGKAWEENVVVEGRLITGQNPASAKKVARSIIEALRKQ